MGFVEELLLIVSWPVTEPVTVGSNCRLRFTACPGLKVIGNVAPDTEKPAPVTVAELTVTLAVPVELSVRDWLVGVFTTVLPNATLAALIVNVGTAAFSCREKPIDVLPELAVMVTDCAVPTAFTVALNAALVDAAGTVTEAGTVTALLLLERLTATPPVGADPVNVTVHASVPAPVMDELLQYTALTVGAVVVPVPLKLTAAVGLVDELLVIVS